MLRSAWNTSGKRRLADSPTSIATGVEHVVRFDARFAGVPISHRPGRVGLGVLRDRRADSQVRRPVTRPHGASTRRGRLGGPPRSDRRATSRLDCAVPVRSAARSPDVHSEAASACSDHAPSSWSGTRHASPAARPVVRTGVSAPLLRRASNFVDTGFLVITIELTGASEISPAPHLFCLTLGHLAFRRGLVPVAIATKRVRRVAVQCRGDRLSESDSARHIIRSHHPTASGVKTVKSRLPRSLRPSRKNRSRWTSQPSRFRGLRVETLEDRRLLTTAGGMDIPTAFDSGPEGEERRPCRLSTARCWCSSRPAPRPAHDPADRAAAGCDDRADLLRSGQSRAGQSALVLRARRAAVPHILQTKLAATNWAMKPQVQYAQPNRYS